MKAWWCRSQNDACTSLASFLWSPISGTADISTHQLGVSHLSPLYGTHWLNSVTTGSGGILLPSSSEVPVTLSRRMPPLVLVLVAPPNANLWLWLLPHWTPSSGHRGSWGQGGLQTTPDCITSSTPPYYIPSGPCSWILPSLLGSSGCNLIFLFLL